MRGARLQGFLSGDNKPPAAELIIKGVDGKEEKKPNSVLEGHGPTGRELSPVFTRQGDP
jgi:hypothetical protein